MVTTDFSDESRRAYVLASILAKKFSANLYLVHFGRRHAAEGSGILSKEHVQELNRDLADEMKCDAFAGIRVKARLLNRRDFRSALWSLEQNAGSGLVVTTTWACSGLKRFLSVNDADTILASSSVPVLLLGPAAEINDSDHPKRVLVPFDFSETAMEVLPTLRFLAWHYSCAFKVLFVQRPSPERIRWYQRLWLAFRIHVESPEVEFAELKDAELDGVDVELEVCQGVPEVEIIDRVRQMKADLIVFGTSGKLGAMAQKVTREATCPVLAVPIQS